MERLREAERRIAGMQDQILNLHELNEDLQQQLNRATAAIAALEEQAQRGRNWSYADRWHEGGHDGSDTPWRHHQ